MRYDNIIPFTYQRYVIKNTIDIRTVCEQNDHEYVISTVPLANTVKTPQPGALNTTKTIRHRDRVY